MNDTKKLHIIINITYLSLLGLLIYFGLRYALYWFLPFLLGFLIASILKPMIRKLHAYTRISKRFWAWICLFIFYSMGLGILIYICMKVFLWIQINVWKLPLLYQQVIEPQITYYLQQMNEQFKHVDNELLQAFHAFAELITNAFSSTLMRLSTNTLLGLSNLIKSLPSVLGSLFITILSSVFFTLDYQKIVNFIMRQMTPQMRKLILAMRYYFFENCGGYIKAYSILMTITFIELYIGFRILHLTHAFEYAIMIALFDMLPVLACGGILIPWFIICFLLGMKKLAVGLVIIYLIVTVVHNLLEPKLIGKQVGIHPLILLFAMFVGARFFGILGFLLFPFFMSVLKSLHDQGYLHLFH